VQPLDGSPGRQITNFKSWTFRSFRWSPNGKSLALIRDVSQSDVVPLREASQARSNSWNTLALQQPRVATNADPDIQ
jgi:hypothetical protein